MQNAHDQTLLPGGGGLLCRILSSDLLISYQLLGLYQNRRKDLAKVNITLFIKDNSSYTYEEAKGKVAFLNSKLFFDFTEVFYDSVKRMFNSKFVPHVTARMKPLEMKTKK